jgi:putative transposase
MFIMETMERKQPRRRPSFTPEFKAENDAGDITYIMTWEGWAYLATVIDLSSRRVVGRALADHMRTELVEDALSMAFTQRRPAGAGSGGPLAC